MSCFSPFKLRTSRTTNNGEFFGMTILLFLNFWLILLLPGPRTNEYSGFRNVFGSVEDTFFSFGVRKWQPTWQTPNTSTILWPSNDLLSLSSCSQSKPREWRKKKRGEVRKIPQGRIPWMKQNRRTNTKDEVSGRLLFLFVRGEQSDKMMQQREWRRKYMRIIRLKIRQNLQLHAFVNLAHFENCVRDYRLFMRKSTRWIIGRMAF